MSTTKRARKDRTRVALLGALSVEPMTGAELRSSIAETIGHFWQESYGQIYPTLAKLEEEGLVTGAPVDVGRGRRLHITPKGIAEFKDLIGDLGAPPPPRNTLLLQVFFGRQMGAKWTKKRVQTAREEAVERLGLFDLITDEILAEDHYLEDRPYWLATVEYGRAMATATVSWADATIASLSDSR